jgi:hypothetical protein
MGVSIWGLTRQLREPGPFAVRFQGREGGDVTSPLGGPLGVGTQVDPIDRFCALAKYVERL